jgi:hypothetical protein
MGGFVRIDQGVRSRDDDEHEAGWSHLFAMGHLTGTQPQALEREIRLHLDGPKVGLLLDDTGGQQPFIAVEGALASVYGHLWNAWLHRAPARACLQCARVFQPTKVSERYCSERCGQQHRQQRYRDRKKGIAAGVSDNTTPSS